MQNATLNPPPVKVLLAALVWLAARQRQAPDPATLCAIAHHLHLLVLHSAADHADVQAGLRLAGAAGLDAVELLARCAGATTSLH